MVLVPAAVNSIGEETELVGQTGESKNLLDIFREESNSTSHFTIGTRGGPRTKPQQSIASLGARTSWVAVMNMIRQPTPRLERADPIRGHRPSKRLVSSAPVRWPSEESFFVAGVDGRKAFSRPPFAVQVQVRSSASLALVMFVVPAESAFTSRIGEGIASLRDTTCRC